MRRLILARHAEASWGNPALTDHARPLSIRGRGAATRIGNALSDLGCNPAVVYVSTAARTRETWAQMEPAFASRPSVDYRRDLYLATPRTVLDAVAAAPHEADTIMVVGHNPATHAVAAHLARAGDLDDTHRLRRQFPPGTAAVIDLVADAWTDVERGGTLKHFILPHRLARRLDRGSP